MKVVVAPHWLGETNYSKEIRETMAYGLSFSDIHELIIEQYLEDGYVHINNVNISNIYSLLNSKPIIGDISIVYEESKYHRTGMGTDFHGKLHIKMNKEEIICHFYSQYYEPLVLVFATSLEFFEMIEPILLIAI